VALLPLLLKGDEEIKWLAVTAAGIITARLAESDMEAARIFIRRMIWNLTEESGGCAWGAPEFIAEALANHRRLAEEFVNILISYIIPEGNFLDHDPLRRGAVWGLGRLAEVYPDLLIDSVPYLCDSLKSDDPYIRGFACRALGILNNHDCIGEIETLASDKALITIYERGKLNTRAVGTLADEALKNLG